MRRGVAKGGHRTQKVWLKAEAKRQGKLHQCGVRVVAPVPVEEHHAPQVQVAKAEGYRAANEHA